MNERITDSIVRSHLDESLKKDGFGAAWYDEQIPSNRRIKNLLAKASKNKSGERGAPDFTVMFDKYPEFLIVIECKADPQKHMSEEQNNPKNYAVDGVLHYARYLSKEFNVLAIAVSGMDKSSLQVSHFWQFKEKLKESNAFGKELLFFDHYINEYKNHGTLSQQKYDDFLACTYNVNNILHNLKITEDKRSLLVCAILIALNRDSFISSFEKSDDPKVLLANIRDIFLSTVGKSVKREAETTIREAYRFMDNLAHPILRGRVLINLIKEIKDGVDSFRGTQPYFDMLGQFYVEFLRYSYKDKKLGIVLTPNHITDFAARIADIRKDDVIYDNCAGTGGFLISSMKIMIDLVKNNTDRKINEKQIRNKGIVGVEINPEVSALLCSNMLIHQDGKSNFIFGDCFDIDIQTKVKKYEPTIGLLNPPFKSYNDELDFVLNNLSSLKPGGKCVALLPMQCALAQKGIKFQLKKQLLEKHTLEAVLSLPDQLFYNRSTGVSVVTCLVILTAHQPHKKNKKTWFGYCKDDGFVIRKPKGRTDYYKRWEAIRDDWLKKFENREEKKGFSIMKEVSAEDEWCAEAYMKTDYEKLTEKDFIDTMKNFIAYKFLSEN